MAELTTRGRQHIKKGNFVYVDKVAKRGTDDLLGR